MVLPPRNGLSLCAGAGGLDMGLMLAEPDFHTRCFVEWEEYPRESLIAAQRAGYFEPAPIWDDVTTFDAKPIAGAIDTILAGYPCQPFSQAGQRKGEDDERHLWPDIERIIEELGSGLRWCFFENVAGHLTLGLETVVRALHGLGFRVAVGLFSAGEVGASHERQRIFIVAYRESVDRGGKLPQSGAGSRRPRPSGGRRELADAGHSGWGQDDAAGHDDDRTDAGRPEGDGGFGKRRDTLVHAEGGGRRIHPGPGREGIGAADARGRGGAVGNPEGIGRREGRAQPDIRRGRDASAISGGELADSHDPGSQGQQRNQLDPQGWEVEARHARLRSGAGLFPPGPGDHSAWASILAMAPDLAPAFALGDVARRADQLAAMVASGRLAEAEAEPDLRGMVDGLAQRSRALRLLGNGVVPLAAAYAWRTLSAAHGLGWLDLGADRDGDRADAGRTILTEDVA